MEMFFYLKINWINNISFIWLFWAKNWDGIDKN